MDLPPINNALSTSAAHHHNSKNKINHSSNNISGGSRGIAIPPGFSGDALRAVSASAPPPGFYALAEQQQRDHAAAMVLQKPWQTSSGGYYTFNNNDDQNNASEDGDDVVDDYDAQFGLLEEQRRTMSYMNLAEAIGESMAQSMEDSFVSTSKGGGAEANTSSSFGQSITTNEP